MQETIIAALRRGAPDEALALARSYVQAEPGMATAHRMLAMALHAGDAPEAALDAIDAALGIDPEDAQAHFQRAVILGSRREVEAAQQALAQTLRLDPNQFGAYILQAQFALGRDDLDEAARLARLAARLEPEHPWLQAIEGMVALGRNQADEALAVLTQAAAKAPDDPQLLLPLALAYIAKGHDAFAEQALRRLVDDHGGALAWRVLLAQALARQGRPDEALQALAPALSDAGPDAVTPAVLRLAGELELAAGRPAQALSWLRRNLAATPHDTAALQAAMAAWQRLGDRADARSTLDGLLAAAPATEPLWQARLALESDDPAAAQAVVARWSEAMPDAPAVLEGRLRVALHSGDEEAALGLAHELAGRVPGSVAAHSVIVEALQRRDPAEAIAHVTGLLELAGSDRARDALETRLALLEDADGRHADAAARWEALAGRRTPSLPLPPVSLPATETAAGPWPEWSARGEDDAPVQTLLLWGPPGSCVENVAALLSGVRGFRADRMTESAPGDVFQRFDSIPGLSGGQLDPAQAARDWRARLPGRGIQDAHVIDWLVWWDNALLRVLRPHVPNAGVLFVLRDPRDMLLQWAAFDSPMRFAMPSMMEAAWWLERRLAQILEAASLYRVAVLCIDGSESDEAGLCRMVSGALGMELAPSGRPLSHSHFAPGHWRRYTEALAAPFALLTPVAKALGYPED